MIFSTLHSELIVPFVVAMYGFAVLVWTAICYVVIKYWLKRRQKN